MPPLQLPATVPAPSQPTSKPVQRVAFLDSLRFLASAAVVLQHLLERTDGVGRLIVSWTSPGVFGVVLFFIISGFVIPMATERGFSLRKFIIRRLFRIYPLVIFAFILVFIFSSFLSIRGFEYAKEASVADWAANIGLVQDYFGLPALLGVTWTLSLEFAWYFIFAASLSLLGRRCDRVLVIAAPAIMSLCTLASLWLEHRLPLGRIGMIYLAVLGFRLYRYVNGEVDFATMLLDAAAFLLVTGAANIVSFGYFRHPNITLWQAGLPWTVAPATFLCVCLVPAIRTGALINNPKLAWLGSISFSTYLLHPFAIIISQQYIHSALFPAAGILLTYALSLFGYRCVEVPGQWLGKWVTSSRGSLHVRSRADLVAE